MVRLSRNLDKICPREDCVYATIAIKAPYNHHHQSR
jgi:hypothetical protein